MKVLVSLNIPKIGIDMLRKEGLEVTVWENDDLMTHEELLAATQKHDILLSASPYQINSDFLSRNQQLKLISQYAVGYDNINVKKANEMGILVANTPYAMVEATADIAFALLLAVSRKLFFMHKKIIADEWGAFRPQAHLGRELKGLTVGIFGLGRIGTAFAARCRGAYGMNVLYHNRSRNVLAEKEVGATYVSFDELLRQSDIVSVHCALTPETAEKFNERTFGMMKPSSIFLNTARGGIHNEDDLINALRNQVIWGAGLDVTNPEPMKYDNPLLSMENVAVSPHIGSATLEARNEMSRLAALNIIQYCRGEKMSNQVV
ncbi:MAG: D-glycerate dehydrogenase [Maribacter sp.]|nr:D-glycerate dehydrogenase [Maribacter sp.]